MCCLDEFKNLIKSYKYLFLYKQCFAISIKLPAFLLNLDIKLYCLTLKHNVPETEGVLKKLRGD
jgi:hypothetical protein